MTATGSLEGLTGHLETAAREALETMCFYGVLGRAADAEMPDEITTVSLSFYGDARGTMGLRISSGALTELSANFFGEELLDIEPGQTEAVACELANMICGAALSAWEPDGRFELTQPEPAVPAPLQVASEPDVRLPLNLETGKLAICLWME